ncbi:PLAC8-domain-containing protein [Russula ochroleuca]|jgi:Cys-rich protein (TIGR01571 family)|uniref:PLAC8-domain-containing protein n=1 Tax=Russula ochroleuca TaxID=152965 RepID=A0A9P5JW14_9AGAM|nr:PLAC8-domain-containing protein [Russula ochroleuca]
MPLVNMQPVSMQPVSMQPIRMQPASMQPISMRPVSIQPQSTVAMLAGGNRNANNVPSGHDGMRDWSYGLCDGSARCGLCLWSCFCPCVVYTKNRQRMHSLQNQGNRLASGGEYCDCNCCLYLGIDVCSSLSWVLQVPLRAEIRGRYRIRGDACRDCLVSCFCRPCALTQERREIELEESSF